MEAFEDRPTALGILKEALLLSNNEMLPLMYYNKDGEPVEDSKEAVRAEVQYHDFRYNFLLEEMDRFTVH